MSNLTKQDLFSIIGIATPMITGVAWGIVWVIVSIHTLNKDINQGEIIREIETAKQEALQKIEIAKNNPKIIFGNVSVSSKETENNEEWSIQPNTIKVDSEDKNKKGVYQITLHACKDLKEPKKIVVLATPSSGADYTVVVRNIKNQEATAEIITLSNENFSY